MVDSCKPFVAKYGQAMIDEFLNYWLAENDSHTLLAYEIAKRKTGTFDVPRRLKTWASNNEGRRNGPKQVEQPRPQSPRRTPWEQMGITEEQYRALYK